MQHDDLKWFILLRYRAVYLGMDPARRGTIVNALDDATINHLRDTTLGTPSAAGEVEYVLLPLCAAGHTARALARFTAASPADQAAMIAAGGWELLQKLGTAIIRPAAKDWSVFTLLPAPDRADQLDSMSPDEIDALVAGLSMPDRRRLFDAWCATRGNIVVEDKLDYVEGRVTDTTHTSYEASLRNQIYAEHNPAINKLLKRDRKPPDRLKPMGSRRVEFKKWRTKGKKRK